MSSSTPIPADLLAEAQQYLQWEENGDYRAQVEALLAAGDSDQLQAHFRPRIAFGTAGLRAKMAPGYRHMNPLVVQQTSQGFVRYIEQQQSDAAALADARERGIVLGYDGRHNSRRYAEVAAATFLAAGFRVHLFSRMVATPFVPYGLLRLRAVAGLMVTASHNPKEDNGYKVYWSNGAQIIPPHDAGIAAEIMRNLEPWHLAGAAAAGPKALPFDAAHPRISDPFAEVTDAYFAQAAAEYCWRGPDNAQLTQAACPVTFTAMHGVGAPFTARAFEAFGLPKYVPTPSQVEADPEFPTVRFPNPEEGKGALALAMESADAAGSSLILANDPDADRLAVAEKVNGVWTPLNGNQIALLLADWAFTNYVARDRPSKEQLARTCMVASTVSSAVLGAMARVEGFNFYPTLTGFKWMGNRAAQAVAEGERFLFAFEVEIGFLVGPMSYDKDGVRTAAIFYEMYSQLQKQGLTAHDKLEQLYGRYGHFAMRTSYFFCDPLSGKLGEIFGRLRNYPDGNGAPSGTYPTHAGGHPIVSVRDVTLGYDSAEAGNVSTLPRDPSAHMITFRFSNGCTCTMRNSGTEPKLKWYVECSAPEKEEAQKLTDQMTEAIIRDFIQPEINKLEAPKVVA